MKKKLIPLLFAAMLGFSLCAKAQKINTGDSSMATLNVTSVWSRILNSGVVMMDAHFEVQAKAGDFEASFVDIEILDGAAKTEDIAVLLVNDDFMPPQSIGGGRDSSGKKSIIINFDQQTKVVSKSLFHVSIVYAAKNRDIGSVPSVKMKVYGKTPNEPVAFSNYSQQ